VIEESRLISGTQKIVDLESGAGKRKRRDRFSTVKRNAGGICFAARIAIRP
jgi:hypothetical protein